MMLEAVWLKNGKEVFTVSPVMNIVCYENMKSIHNIEIESNKENGYHWYSCDDFEGGADDFIIRVKKE